MTPASPPKTLRRIEPWPRQAGSPLSGARNAIWLPAAPLISCLRAIMSRDTRGVTLDEAQRRNHFPATPVCSITWYFKGSAQWLRPGDPPHTESPGQPLGRVSFTGPITHPVIVRNPGEIEVMTVLLMPDALARMTGIDPGEYINRALPVADVLDPAWLALCAAVDEAPDDPHRIALIESFLLARWREPAVEERPAGRRFADWWQTLSHRAATSGVGRSPRQAERRVKQWAGQSLRVLRGLARSEQVFFEAVAGVRSGEVNWRDLAAGHGYADQSHLCRETRRITGFAPDELRRRIATEEGFWAYRLWGYTANATAITN